MTAHTPGPWLAMRGTESTGRQVADWAISVEKGYVWICTGPSWDDEFQEESFANAHLIAAAPELLAALESSYERIRSLGHGENCYLSREHDLGKQCECGLDGLVSHIETVIAKATGEQP